MGYRNNIRELSSLQERRHNGSFEVRHRNNPTTPNRIHPQRKPLPNSQSEQRPHTPNKIKLKTLRTPTQTPIKSPSSHR
jgi:hypothetical protein